MADPASLPSGEEEPEPRQPDGEPEPGDEGEPGPAPDAAGKSGPGGLGELLARLGLGGEPAEEPPPREPVLESFDLAGVSAAARPAQVPGDRRGAAG